MVDIRTIKIDGLNINAAIEAMEDEAILEAMLRAYYEDGENKLKLMNAALSDKNIKDYSVYVHALKSSSKSIGAYELSEAFKGLEMAAKSFDAEYIRENHEKAVSDFKKLISELECIFAGKYEKQAVFSQEDAAPLMEAIDKKDVDGCCTVLNVLEERNYSSYVKGNLDDIRAAAETGDFEDAKALLEDVLLTIEVSGL